jgi:nicotinate-nucleotide adenylyltransferase
VLAAVYALSTEPIDEVLIVPVYKHPFSKSLASFDDRLEMCRRAFAWIPRVVVSGVERDLDGESLTLRTLEHLATIHPDWSMRLLIGADAIAPPLILGRAGVNADGAPEAVLPRASSTEVREALASGDIASMGKLVPREVLSFIVEHGLYRRN